MKFGSSSFLGLSFSDRGIACAEITTAGGRRVVQRLAMFQFTQEHSLEAPAPTGTALAIFLRQKKFSASRAVAGVSAKWLIAVEKEIPPAGEEQSRSMLRLQAERLAVSESGELIFEYAAASVQTSQAKSLLVGVHRSRLDQIEQLLDAAGLSVHAVTASSFALARSAKGGDTTAPMLVLGRQSAEMVWRVDGDARMLRHMAVASVNGHGPVSVAPLGSELGRTLMLNRVNGSASRELLLWDSVGLSDEQLTELSQKTGLTVRHGSTTSLLNVEAAPDAIALADQVGPPADAFAPAVSLALGAADRGLLPMDFLKSRLTPRPASRVSRMGAWAIFIGAVLLIGIGALYYQVHDRENEFADLTSQINDTGEATKSAQNMVDRVTLGKGFFVTRPPTLECMRDVTLCFRDDEKLWVNSFKLGENRKGSLSGKAVDPKSFRNLLDRLKKNPKFSNVEFSGHA